MSSSSPDPIAEIRLLERIARGEQIAFRDLYGRYSDPLMGLAMQLLNSRSEVEEVIQDTFVRIWRYAGNYDSAISRPFSWAVTITRRLCWDKLRARKSRGDLETNLEEALPQDPADRDDVKKSVEESDLIRSLRATLKDFPESQQRCLELSLFSGYSQSEIAERLNQPLGTVKAWIRRGMLKMRESLYDHQS